MIYNVTINMYKENVISYQSIKIEAEYCEELFDKIKTVCFLMDGFIESISISQEMKREYSKSKQRPIEEKSNV